MQRETTYRTGLHGCDMVMVTYPDAHILDVVGPLDVLTGSEYFLPEGHTPCDVKLLASKAGTGSNHLRPLPDGRYLSYSPIVGHDLA